MVFGATGKLTFSSKLASGIALIFATSVAFPFSVPLAISSRVASDFGGTDEKSSAPLRTCVKKCCSLMKTDSKSRADFDFSAGFKSSLSAGYALMTLSVVVNSRSHVSRPASSAVSSRWAKPAMFYPVRTIHPNMTPPANSGCRM